MAILAVLSDVQQVQQIRDVSTHLTMQCVFKEAAEKVSYCKGGSCWSCHKPDWEIKPAVKSHVGRGTLKTMWTIKFE